MEHSASSKPEDLCKLLTRFENLLIVSLLLCLRQTSHQLYSGSLDPLDIICPSRARLVTRKILPYWSDSLFMGLVVGTTWGKSARWITSKSCPCAGCTRRVIPGEYSLHNEPPTWQQTSLNKPNRSATRQFSVLTKKEDSSTQGRR